MDDNKDPLNEFLNVVGEAKKQFEALLLLSKMIRILTESEDPSNMGPDQMDRVINEIVSYGDQRVFDAQMGNP